ncbi:MAG: 50S ribosomal protein L28 [Actinobacteria bacterium]|nr:50S ribosomal protein L28 [Actinomycetota bacterium]
MSKVCDICKKKPGFGNNVSHSNRKTKRMFKPNIHKAKVEINGKLMHLNLCTKCLKSTKIKKAI